MNPDQEYVKRTIESRDVHFIRFWFTDVMGSMKSFAVNPSEIDAAFLEGIGFDASCISGLPSDAESDMLAIPDASTFQILPWRPDSNAVARMFCDIRTPEGDPFECDPRRLLANVVDTARAMGFEPVVGPEVEYFYFESSSSPTLLDHGGYFDLTSLDSGSDLRRDTVLSLERMGIPVEYSHHELGPSQHEIDLRASDPCSMADAVMTYRIVVKEVAAAHGVHASFMPKPRADCPGSGMHVQMSLFDENDENVFYDENDPSGHNLSEMAKHFIAGLLHYAPEFCLVTNQFVNSYKRLAAGGEAPTRLGWSRTERSTLVRVPGYKPHKKSASRVEMRLPDPACNPYLAFAVMLAAGLKGIEDELLCPDCACTSGNGPGLRVPMSLGEAITPFSESALMREVLGSRVHSFLVEAKTHEWHEYLRAVTPWELDRWLEVL